MAAAVTPVFNRKGFTLIEVLIGAVLFAVLAAGAMLALVGTARMSRNPSSVQYAETNALAQHIIERLRNRVGCDNAAWFNANCDIVPGNLPGWTHEGVDDTSAVNTKLSASRRCYRVIPADCDGIGGAGDCLQVDAQVCWGDMTGCNCP